MFPRIPTTGKEHYFLEKTMETARGVVGLFRASSLAVHVVVWHHLCHPVIPPRYCIETQRCFSALFYLISSLQRWPSFEWHPPGRRYLQLLMQLYRAEHLHVSRASSTQRARLPFPFPPPSSSPPSSSYTSFFVVLGLLRPPPSWWTRVPLQSWN